MAGRFWISRTVKRAAGAGLGDIVQRRGGHAIEQNAGAGLLDAYVDASGVCVVHTSESDKQTGGIDNRNVLRNNIRRRVHCSSDDVLGLVN